MWIVKLALNRPYTFIVMAILIVVISPVMIFRTPTDIFPNIDVPVIAVAWTYSGMNPQEVEGRITSVYERALSLTVDNVQHIESTTINGMSIVKIYLQPGSSIDRANAQVTAISQAIVRQMPAGSLPPFVMNYNASTVPILQLGVSSEKMDESQLYDLASNFIRPQLSTIPGASVPWAYGGKQRQVMINLNPQQLLSKGLAPSDVLSALQNQHLVLPNGTAKIGEFEYDVVLNGDEKTIEGLSGIPVRTVEDSIVYLRDVATIADAFAPQTNVVRQNGARAALVTIYKTGSASTLDVVKGIRGILPRVAQTLPSELQIHALADQSIFVRSAISGVIREALIAAGLTAVMVLIFLGSWRSTLIIAVSIPLSILSSIIALSAMHETINIMTLGGLALAVGILVDDATVVIENINRMLEEGEIVDLKQAILEGSGQISIPALVSTLCICIVFLPMFFLGGVTRYLFVPLAESVIFAMLASYVLSRTLVPTLAMYLLKMPQHNAPHSTSIFARIQEVLEAGFEKLRSFYHAILNKAVHTRKLFIPVFLGASLLAFLLIPFLGQDFFPNTDSGQLILHMRAKTGTRIEETARLADQVEATIRQTIPANQLGNIIDNIGVPYSSVNVIYSRSGLTGAADADIMVSLAPEHGKTDEYIRKLRQTLPALYPSAAFYFLPADIVTQILNFGIPAPIDIQIDGAEVARNHEVAEQMMTELRHVPGLVDLRIQQQFDYPRLDIQVDRTKAAQNGLTERDVANNTLTSLSGSFQVAPMFFLNAKNGVQYPLVAQTPQYRLQSGDDLGNIALNGTNAKKPQILADVASFKRSEEMGSINHYNIRRVVDIYANVQGRDLGSVGRDVNRIVDAHRGSLPRGSFATIRGQFSTMRDSYVELLGGLAFSILLVYLLIVVNLQSWLDPFVIIMALPAALAGIVLMLFFSRTTLSVPALMGAIMCMGVATANSILLVTFARERFALHGDAIKAAIEAGFTRFRPVLMTACAMIIGMIPMALGLGDGGEQNAPLGRAVIGGLMVATVATLFLVPSLFALFHHSHNTPAMPAAE
ncbi:MAG: efflux RND transporter permease subunit [Terracidiphilus sp.]|nr:efflux RND transporter permease subunit [Terracidiphilus sp.]